MTNANTPAPPPHDAEAERSLLAALLLNPDAFALVEAIVQPADFHRPHHGWVYAAVAAVGNRGEPINEVTVAYELSQRGQLVAAGGLPYLSELIIAAVDIMHPAHYARIVVDMAQRRELLSATMQIADSAYNADGRSAPAIIAAAEATLARLHRDTTAGFRHIRDAMAEVLQFPGTVLERKSAAAKDLARLSTGYPALDSLFGGFYRGNLIVIAARPGMGKTALCLGIARHAAVNHRARVAIVTLEMSEREVCERMLSGEAMVPGDNLRTGALTERQYERIWPAAGTLAGTDILFYDSGAVTLPDMRSRLRQLHRQQPLDLVLVDYLQLMSGSGGRRQSRAEQVGELSRGLKGLARELNVPIIAASQLNREVEHRSPPIPQLSDLRESGDIEQDADIVMFIYRESLYYTEEKWERQYPTRPYPRGESRIIVAKHRNGPTGERDLYFHEAFAKFETLEWREAQP